MNIIEFGDHLLSTGDLDPMYLAVGNSGIGQAQKLRLVFTYACFYHLGFSSMMSELPAKKYWAAFEKAVINADNEYGKKDWPRGAERRHFRGKNAWDSYTDLRARYDTPEQGMAGLLGVADGVASTFKQVAYQVEGHVGFGPWIAFKLADVAERVLGYDIDFGDCSLSMYKDPTQGAAVGWLEWKQPEPVDKPWLHPVTPAQIKAAADYYVQLFNKRHKVGSVPGIQRKLTIQEIETIFCKYKSHLKGSYPVGKDTREIKHGLIGWGPLAERMAASM